MNCYATEHYNISVEEMLSQYLRNFLVREMKRRHLTKEQVAENAGVSPRTVQRWRNNDGLQDALLVGIMRGLQVSPQEIFRDFGKEPAGSLNMLIMIAFGKQSA